MQQQCGVRVQAALARGRLGRESWGGLQGQRRELQQQSFKARYRIQY